MEDKPILISVKETSKLLNMSEKIKGFPAIILPHKILIDKNQIQTWISKNYGTFKN